MLVNMVKNSCDKSSLLTIALVSVITLSGCGTTFRETHFFKEESSPGQIANYYRLVVSGQTNLSSARYISGYFDEDIVNQYFNEIGQPDKARLTPVGQSSKSTDTKGDAASTAVKNSAQGIKDPALVLLLSSNSDDIANQLGALAQSQEFTASLAGLIAAPRFKAAADAESRLRIDQSRGCMVATLGDQLVTGLPDKPTPQEAEARLLEFVNQLASGLGAPESFKTMDDAAAWLRENRARLHKWAN